MTILPLVLALAVLACATKPAPPAAKVAPTVAAGDDPVLARWQTIRANKFEPPAGTAPTALLGELEQFLASPDPVRRDTIAYDALAAWIVVDKRLAPAELKPFALRMAANLAAPLDVRDGVFLRSFSALVLSLVVKRDLDEPFLDDAARRGLLAAAHDYAARETDLRGHTGEHGWAHAAAHTADLLKMLAREPSLSPDDRAQILDAVAGLTVRRHGAILHHGEDGRLAQPALEAIRAGVPPERISAWLAAIAKPLGERGGETFDAALYAAQRNARNLLFTLFVQLSLDPKPNENSRAFLDELRKLLAS